MKHAVTFAFILSLFLPLSPFSSATIYESDFSALQKINLYKENKVWLVHGWNFPYNNKVMVNKGRETSFERFDRSGNRTEEVEYDSLGRTVFSCQYFFDENGNELRRAGLDGKDIMDERWNYAPMSEEQFEKLESQSQYKNSVYGKTFYSDSLKEMSNEKKNSNLLADAKVVEKTSLYKKSLCGNWIFKKDVHKNKVKELHFDANGNFAYKLQFAFDKNQRLNEKTEYDAFGNQQEKWEYKYDEKGNNVETYCYVSNNMLYRKYIMLYDKKGNMTSKFTFDSNENELNLTVYLYEFYGGLHAPRALGNKE
ncbi:MAG: hypothetical protein HY063_12900 [Bacteroidetes bacterium]|nr:hypothetical protein [Bacteroidota bacterium]